MSNPFKLSVSKSKTFVDCKKKYQFSYILKMPKKTRDYHILGSFCHKILEDFHKLYIKGCLLPYNMAMKDCFDGAVEFYKDKLTPEMKQEAWKMMDQYLKIIYQSGKLNVLDCEREFNLQLSDQLTINGMIDKISMGSDGVLEVSDYKTTKNKKYLQNDWFQLLTYCYVMLMEDQDITKIRASYILLRHDWEYITKEFYPEEILTIREKYLDYFVQIQSEQEYAAQPTFLCNYCDFLEHCAEGKSVAINNSSVYGETSW